MHRAADAHPRRRRGYTPAECRVASNRLNLGANGSVQDTLRSHAAVSGAPCDFQSEKTHLCPRERNHGGSSRGCSCVCENRFAAAGRAVQQNTPWRPHPKALKVAWPSEWPLHRTAQLALHSREATDVVPGNGRQLHRRAAKEGGAHAAPRFFKVARSHRRQRCRTRGVS